MKPNSPTTTPTALLSLPDELLVEIVTGVATTTTTHRPDLANTRLTCRRLAAAGAHLIVQHVRLEDISARSLEKLEAVARHPAVGRGVRVVHVVPRCYSPRLAGGLDVFAWHAADRAYRTAREYKRGLLLLEQEERLDVGWRVLRRARMCLKAWTRLAQRGGPEPRTTCGGGEGADGEKVTLTTPVSHWQQLGDDERDAEEREYTEMMIKAYERYRSRYEEQEALRKNNAFTARIAAAMALMPRAKTLEFGDALDDDDDDAKTDASGRLGSEQDPLQESDDDFDRLLDMDGLQQPMSWGEAMVDDGQAERQGAIPIEILLTLPRALQRAGASRLDRLCVRTETHPDDYRALLHRHQTTTDNFAELAAAVDALGVRDFAFINHHHHGCRPRAVIATAASDALERFIRAMTASRRLERLRLSIDNDGLQSSPLILLPALSPSNSLKDLYLSGVGVSAADLKRLAVPALDFLTLKARGGGAWARALEDIEVGCVKEMIVLTAGAEELTHGLASSREL